VVDEPPLDDELVVELPELPEAEELLEVELEELEPQPASKTAAAAINSSTTIVRWTRIGAKR
jgi:hypothetical protein